jgi:polyhydroxybutyrate depolymerase
VGNFTTRRGVGGGLLLGALLMLAACGDEASDPELEADAGDAKDAGSGDAGDGSDAGDHGSRGSPGCNARSASAGDHDESLAFGGKTRSYRLHVPAGYDGEPTALVVSMHGFLSNPLEQAKFSGMSEVADERGFIVVYPSGAGEPPAWNAGDCCEYVERERDDVAFIGALVDAVGESACIDLARVYATGHSNGGFLSHRIACELSDRIAAIASVSGVLGVAPADCQPERPVPVLQIHGDADPTIPYGGGSPEGWELLYPGLPAPTYRSVAETVSFWREHDGCDASRTQVYSEGDANCQRYDGCDAGSEVTLCTLSGGGHTWPGGDPTALEAMVLGLPVTSLIGVTSTSLDASAYIWDFFERHPLP